MQSQQSQQPVSKNKKPLKSFVKLTELEKTQGWFIPDLEKVIPFDQLTTRQLKEALRDAEARELKYFNKSAFFSQMAEKLTAETERRGLEPDHYNTEFTMSSRNIKVEQDEQQS